MLAGAADVAGAAAAAAASTAVVAAVERVLEGERKHLGMMEWRRL